MDHVLGIIQRSSFLPGKKVVLGVLIVATLAAIVTLTQRQSPTFTVITSSSKQLVARVIDTVYNSAYGGEAARSLNCSRGSRGNNYNNNGTCIDHGEVIKSDFKGTNVTAQATATGTGGPLSSQSENVKETTNHHVVASTTSSSKTKSETPAQGSTKKDAGEANTGGSKDTSKPAASSVGDQSTGDPKITPQESNEKKPVAEPDATKRPSLGPGESHVTYDPDVVVRCPQNSPYVFCDGKPAMRTPEEQAEDARRHPPFKVSFVKTASWYPKLDFSKCPYNNCVIDGKPKPDTDHVHIYGVSLNSGFPRPTRYGNQTWSFGAWESPHHTHADFLSNDHSAWNSVFNMTISYRVDSDVFVPYGLLAFEPTPLDQRPNYMEIAKGKTKSVAWFVSNCNTPSKRRDYVNEMKKYIDVDIYGGCGIPCSKKNGICTKNLPLMYKFYLSFENSLCTDYISEKLFKIYTPDMHVIPVARGGAAYTKYFPPNTLVDAANFKTARELALYLKDLGSDLPRYAQMLEQKDMYRKFSGLGDMWCHFCRVLNTKGPSRKTYSSMKEYWQGSHCRKADDIR